MDRASSDVVLLFANQKGSSACRETKVVNDEYRWLIKELWRNAESYPRRVPPHAVSGLPRLQIGAGLSRDFFPGASAHSSKQGCLVEGGNFFLPIALFFFWPVWREVVISLKEIHRGY